jgi:Zn-dependent metalloprotease
MRRLILMSSVGFVLILTFLTSAQLQQNLPEKIASKQAGHQRQSEGRPAADVVAHWQAFAAQNAKPIAVTWSPQTGTPESLFGELSAKAERASAKAARRFLGDNARLFKFKVGLGDLALVDDFDTPMGRHFVFQQTFEGVPVYGGRTADHFNKAGTVVGVSNKYVPNVYQPTSKPPVTRDDALQMAQAQLRLSAPAADVTSELVVYSEGQPTLAWQIVIPTDGPTWELFIDAQSGAPIGEPRDINRYATGTGQVFNVNAVVATHDNSLRDNDDAASAVPASAYSIVTLLGLVGNGFLDGQYASSEGTRKRATSATNSFIFDRNNDGFSEVMGYYYLDYAERYIQSLGFTNVNNRQQVFSVNRLKIDNSFYSPQKKEITYGLGGVDDAEDAEVILHEYGHSIQDNQVPNFGSSLEAGSMGEGFGDYWAGTVGAQFSGGFQDLCIAEWDATSYSSTNPPCLRRLDSTKHYPESVAGEVHDDGEMWSAALWQIRVAVGANLADQAILQAHFLLTPTASFSQGANALVTSAINLGYGKQQVKAIRTILQNRGFTVTV